MIRAGDDDLNTLEECLASRATEARFWAFDDNYVCAKCGKLSDAVHYRAVGVCPPILILRLLRFQNDLTRIQSFVSFPQRLSLPLNNGTGKSCQYSLRAIDEHYGTLLVGHHIATVRVGQQEPAVWFRCNDAIITPRVPQYQSNRDVYLLFYDRIDLRE
jgi:ubiquitin C-terminal hydrolase